jgi:hypothetical protein
MAMVFVNVGQTHNTLNYVNAIPQSICAAVSVKDNNTSRSPSASDSL